MGCAVSCLHQTTMALFGKYSNNNDDARAKLERKLYLAKESPESDFDLSDCELQQVPSGIYSICKVYRKEYLYLQNNNLKSMDNGGQISDLYLIKILNLSNNKFNQFPNIQYLVSLTELYVQSNYISEIPDSIEYLQNLQILDVSRNNLLRLSPVLGKLRNLRRLNIVSNKDLKELCPDLCFATKLTQIELDEEQFLFPPPEVALQGTVEIMKYLCEKMNVIYHPPSSSEVPEVVPVLSPTVKDLFTKRESITWEEHEAALVQQEHKIHTAAKQQREKFLTKIIQEQSELDFEIVKIQEAKDIERQKLIKSIQNDEKEIECLVKNFIQSENLKPEIVQQQLAHEQAEHDRLLEITRQHYDNIRKSDILKAMEMLIEEDYILQHSKKNYEDSFQSVKNSMLIQELEGAEKMEELLKVKDESRTVLVQNLLEDQDIQKAVVASLVERVDPRSWSLNEEISLISSHLAKLSVIEQEKKKLQVSYNYNELLHQRTQLINLLDDLLDQQTIRRKQLIETMKEMEYQADKSTDFWLKNYQKLLDSAPKSLVNIGKHLDPVFANYLLQEGVIHCLPFLVKFLFSDVSLLNITLEKLKDNGVSLSSDREGIIRAIDLYVGSKKQIYNSQDSQSTTFESSAPPEGVNKADEPVFNGVVSPDENECALESECVICMDSKCEVVFVPCGHMCCCQPCANKEVDDCPMCRCNIERKIKVLVP